MQYYTYITSIGPLTIAEEGGSIVGIQTKAMSRGSEQETALIRRTYAELMEYFTGTRRSFDIPLAPRGTPFQQQVWAVLRTIPYGETRSYKEIAEQIGNPRACRAVGGANNKNPIMILIPCHRVVGSDGALVGFAAGLEVKKRLLQLEKSAGFMYTTCSFTLDDYIEQ